MVAQENRRRMAGLEKPLGRENESGTQPGSGQGRRDGTDFPTEYNQKGLWIKEALPSIDNYGLHCLSRPNI